MGKPVKIKCLYCEREYPPDTQIYDGCPACRESQNFSNLTVLYRLEPLTLENIHLIHKHSNKY
jgi:Zn finger protein HypA/HybF involved in hydrogenase expression